MKSNNVKSRLKQKFIAKEQAETQSFLKMKSEISSIVMQALKNGNKQFQTIIAITNYLEIKLKELKGSSKELVLNEKFYELVLRSFLTIFISNIVDDLGNFTPELQDSIKSLLKLFELLNNCKIETDNTKLNFYDFISEKIDLLYSWWGGYIRHILKHNEQDLDQLPLLLKHLKLAHKAYEKVNYKELSTPLLQLQHFDVIGLYNAAKALYAVKTNNFKNIYAYLAKAENAVEETRKLGTPTGTLLAEAYNLLYEKFMKEDNVLLALFYGKELIRYYEKTVYVHVNGITNIISSETTIQSMNQVNQDKLNEFKESYQNYKQKKYLQVANKLEDSTFITRFTSYKKNIADFTIELSLPKGCDKKVLAECLDQNFISYTVNDQAICIKHLYKLIMLDLIKAFADHDSILIERSASDMVKPVISSPVAEIPPAVTEKNVKPTKNTHKKNANKNSNRNNNRVNSSNSGNNNTNTNSNSNSNSNKNNSNNDKNNNANLTDPKKHTASQNASLSSAIISKTLNFDSGHTYVKSSLPTHPAFRLVFDSKTVLKVNNLNAHRQYICFSADVLNKINGRSDRTKIHNWLSSLFVRCKQGGAQGQKGLVLFPETIKVKDTSKAIRMIAKPIGTATTENSNGGEPKKHTLLQFNVIDLNHKSKQRR